MKKHFVLLFIGLLLAFSPAATLAENINNLGIGTTAPASISTGVPEMVYPGDGHTLDLEGAYMFKVKLVAGATGYLFGLFQDGTMVYENWRDNQTLSPNGEFALWEDNPAHAKFHAGAVRVMVRASINGSWSDARTINITLRSRLVASSPTPISMAPTPSPAPTLVPIPTPTSTPQPTPTPAPQVLTPLVAANPGNFLVKPYLIYPADKPMYPAYEAAVKNYMTELQNWYKQKAGATFSMAPLQVIRSSENYLTLRCGANPSSACLNDPAKLDGNVGAYANKAIHNGVENWDQKTATLIFAAGAGGYAGANNYPNDTGFAVVGDWVLEPLSGVANDWGIPCKYSDGWQCSGGVPKGSPAHELDHAFGLPHPDGTLYPGDHVSIMKWHGDYPTVGFLPNEINTLRQSPFFHIENNLLLINLSTIISPATSSALLTAANLSTITAVTPTTVQTPTELAWQKIWSLLGYNYSLLLNNYTFSN